MIDTVANPAETIVACPDGKENVSADTGKVSIPDTFGLGLSITSLITDTKGISNIIDIAAIRAVFFPILPPKINNIISTVGQKISLPYNVIMSIMLSTIEGKKRESWLNWRK